jgi:hypothetical protein
MKLSQLNPDNFDYLHFLTAEKDGHRFVLVWDIRQPRRAAVKAVFEWRRQHLLQRTDTVKLARLIEDQYAPEVG